MAKKISLYLSLINIVYQNRLLISTTKVCLLVLLSITLYSCNNSITKISQDSNIIINQTNYLELSEYKFIINNNLFYIIDISNVAGSFDKPKIVYKKRIPKEKLQAIKRDINSNDFLELDDKYTCPALGGFYWDISINWESVNKSISVENCNLKILDRLFEDINELIPKKKPKIALTSWF